MTQQQKEMLLKNLFPTSEVRKFLCDDLFEEFKAFLPKQLVFSANNKNASCREQNLNFAKQQIKDFVLKDEVYNKIIFEKLKIRDFDFLIEYLLVGYMFNLSLTQNLDVFSDKRSILYGQMLNFLYG